MLVGARILALGGGTGLAELLLALKHLPLGHLTAVVAVSDDGGSTGRLRREFDMPAVGDVRHCLEALAEDDELLTRLFAHRFGGVGELGGHALGNLFITAMLQITGDLSLAVRLSGEVLKVCGTILPATASNVRLMGSAPRGNLLEGEGQVTAAGPPERVWLEPQDPPAVPEAVAGVQAADLVTLGPGSLFTSLIPNLLVPELAEAIRKRRGRFVWVANLMTQQSETLHMSLEDHLAAIARHVDGLEPDIVLANSTAPSEAVRRRYAEEDAEPLVAGDPQRWPGPGRLVPWPLLHETAEGPVRHDRRQLVAAVASLLEETS